MGKIQICGTILWYVTLMQVLGLTGSLKQLSKARRDTIEEVQAIKTIL
jgi:hypothetical protein